MFSTESRMEMCLLWAFLIFYHRKGSFSHNPKEKAVGEKSQEWERNEEREKAYVE